MKKILKIGIVLVVILMTTGCVKIEFSMGIHKDKSMDVQIIEAIDESMFGDDDSLNQTLDLEKAKNQGFTATEYTEGTLKGYTFTKTFKNIDDLGASESDYVADLNLLFEEANPPLFTVEKGFFKNVYKAKFKISSTDMDDLNSSMDDNSTLEDDFSSDDSDFDFDSSLDDSQSDFSSDLDYAQMMSNMDMKFVINLPYKALNNNATSVNNNGKELTWNLLTAQNETIDFEFELYNMTSIYIVVGGILIVVILLVIVFTKGRGKTTKNKGDMSNLINNQNQYMNSQNNAINTNSVNNSISQSSNTASVDLQNNPSNNAFINSQNTGIDTPVQPSVNPAIPTPVISNDVGNQINSNNVDTIQPSITDQESLSSNQTDTIFSVLDSVNYVDSSSDNSQVQSITSVQNSLAEVVIPEQDISVQSVVPEPSIPDQSNQNLNVDNNQLFNNQINSVDSEEERR